MCILHSLPPVVRTWKKLVQNKQKNWEFSISSDKHHDWTKTLLRPNNLVSRHIFTSVQIHFRCISNVFPATNSDEILLFRSRDFLWEEPKLQKGKNIQRRLQCPHWYLGWISIMLPELTCINKIMFFKALSCYMCTALQSWICIS